MTFDNNTIQVNYKLYGNIAALRTSSKSNQYSVLYVHIYHNKSKKSNWIPEDLIKQSLIEFSDSSSGKA